MKCPKCGLGTSPVKCDHCGDIRCNSNGHGLKLDGCATKEGPFGKSGLGGSNGFTCKVCGKGKYHNL